MGPAKVYWKYLFWEVSHNWKNPYFSYPTGSMENSWRYHFVFINIDRRILEKALNSYPYLTIFWPIDSLQVSHCRWTPMRLQQFTYVTYVFEHLQTHTTATDFVMFIVVILCRRHWNGKCSRKPHTNGMMRPQPNQLASSPAVARSRTKKVIPNRNRKKKLLCVFYSIIWKPQMTTVTMGRNRQNNKAKCIITSVARDVGWPVPLQWFLVCASSFFVFFGVIALLDCCAKWQ